MASFRAVRPLGIVLDPLLWIDDGTLCRQLSPPPGIAPAHHQLHAARKKQRSRRSKASQTAIPPVPVAADGFIERIRAHEGIVPFMYRDTKQLVTVGIGFLIEDPKTATLTAAGKKMPFVKRGTFKRAEEADIQEDFDRVKAAPLPDKHSYKEFLETFKKATKLDLEPAYIEQRFNDLIASFQRQLAEEFPLFSSYPIAVRYALLDMIFNLGSAGLGKYKNLRKALDNKDWDAAGEQCHRNGIGKQRNDETKSWFHSAAAAEHFHLN